MNDDFLANAKPTAPQDDFLANAKPATATPPPEGFWHSLGAQFGLTPEAAQAAAQDRKDHPIKSAVEDLLGPGWTLAKGLASQAKQSAGELGQAYDAAKEGNTAGVAQHVITAVPIVGPALAKGADQYAQGNYAGEAGTLLGASAQAAPIVAGAIGRATPAKAGSPPGGPSPPKSGNLPSAWYRATAGPQSTVMPSAAKLPLAAQSGVEDIFRAAAPTGKNIGFRENLNVVAPDLADIARKVDVAEAKGGIINPDMRVRATVDAIRSHLDEMVQNERVPQIERNAQLPVKVGTNPNAVRGLEYLEGTAGDVADSQLARKALDGETLTVAEADKLARVANQTLLSFERMTPEGKMQLQTASPKVGGLKALDNDLRDNLNGVLMSNGEKGLYSYERRYAGLSAVLDQLQTRMNATELKQEGVFGAVGRYTRPVLKVIKEGPSGVPSASQAAVSDVNIGRTLQTGLKKLKSSGITASGSQ